VLGMSIYLNQKRFRKIPKPLILLLVAGQDLNLRPSVYESGGTYESKLHLKTRLVYGGVGTGHCGNIYL